MAEYVEVNFADLKKQVKATFMGVGVPANEADIVTASLLDAEASHVESHGLNRMKPYVERLANGTMTKVAKLNLQMNGAVGILDGGNSLGQVVAHYATEKVIENAKKFGIAAIAVHNSNHFGTAGFYSHMMSDAGCIGITLTNSGPYVAPFGGKSRMLGTNPIAVCFPTTKRTFCGDFATSTVSNGKITIYAKKGDPVPVGWALDSTTGEDTTDSAKALKGILLPLGGYKGYCLGMIVEMLSAMLSRAKFSYESTSMFIATTANPDVGHFIMAIDIEHFLPLAEFKERAEKFCQDLKTSPAREGMEILTPGEPEDRERAKVGEHIKVLAKTMTTINELYEKYGKR